MNKAELKGLCDMLDVEYNRDDTNSVLVEKIQESGKYNAVHEKTGAKIEIKDGKKTHPTLGEYLDVVVHARDPKEGSIFASIGLYTVEFQPEEKISLPKKMIKFLKQAYTIEHYFDPQAITENGNVGAHLSREVPRYIVELADSRLDW